MIMGTISEIAGSEVSIADKAKELRYLYGNRGNWNGRTWGFDEVIADKIEDLIILIAETAKTKGV